MVALESKTKNALNQVLGIPTRAAFCTPVPPYFFLGLFCLLNLTFMEVLCMCLCLFLKQQLPSF